MVVSDETRGLGARKCGRGWGWRVSHVYIGPSLVPRPTLKGAGERVSGSGNETILGPPYMRHNGG